MDDAIDWIGDSIDFNILEICISGDQGVGKEGIWSDVDRMNQGNYINLAKSQLIFDINIAMVRVRVWEWQEDCQKDKYNQSFVIA